ncbi:tyrosine-type recombinase/integrase [Streptomyces sp. YGL11-2]|uniref:tyrosine-type recombinase/integrase n=1 Tax=Streptomyces sp. YGL11-2 TaxID=3414028 RepID=UPI003CEFC965
MHSLVATNSRGGGRFKDWWDENVWRPDLGEAGTTGCKVPEDESSGWAPSGEHGLHALRHTHASTLLEAGESLVLVARWLGHEDPAFTLRTYRHVMPDSGTRGLEALDAWVGGG